MSGNIYVTATDSQSNDWSSKAKEAKTKKPTKEEINKVTVLSLRLDTGEENKFVFNGKKHFDMFTLGSSQFMRMKDRVITIVKPSHRGKNIEIATVNQTSTFPISDLQYLEPSQGRLNYQGHNVMLFKQNTKTMTGKNNDEFVCFAWSENQVLYMESAGLQKNLVRMKGIVTQLVDKMLIPDAFKFILRRKDF